MNLVSCAYDKTVVTIGSEFDNTWSFNSENGYTYDSNLVEIVNGKAQLKTLDLEHSGDDFNNGTHVGSHLFCNHLTQNSSNTKVLKTHRLILRSVKIKDLVTIDRINSWRVFHEDV